MLDFILGLFLAALLVRGWTRGFVREILDLIGLVVGLWIAFKLNAPFGDFLTQRFGVTPEVARIGAGIALFFLFGASLSVAAHYLSKVMNLPGLNLVNRVGGSAVAVGWGVALVLVIINVVRIFPIPESWEEELDDSTVAQAVAGPNALPQRAFEAMAGDNVMGALDAIQDIFGTSRAVPQPGEELSIPAARSDEVRQVRDEAATVLDEINRIRTGLGLQLLVDSTGMTEIAENRAASMYTSGSLFLTPDCFADLAPSGVRVAVCGEGVALAGTALGALDGIREDTTGNRELSSPAYDRAGISVVEGPTGRLLVIVFGG